MADEIRFVLNGKEVAVTADPATRLIDLLRDAFGLTGTKEGCGIGECGACSVIIDGLAVNACLVLAGQVDGTRVMTVEGLARDGTLHPLQEAFLRKGAVQCGFCSPGMLMSAHALLLDNPHADVGDIVEAISGNLCRCTGYKQIVEAVAACTDDPNSAKNARS